MNGKVTGTQTHVLRYFSSVFAIIAWVGLLLFVLQLTGLISTPLQASAQQPALWRKWLSLQNFPLQVFILSILLPGCLFCSYLSLKLQMSSRYYRNALRLAAAAMLPIAPLVSALGIYTLWLSFKRNE